MITKKILTCVMHENRMKEINIGLLPRKCFFNVISLTHIPQMCLCSSPLAQSLTKLNIL